MIIYYDNFLTCQTSYIFHPKNSFHYFEDYFTQGWYMSIEYLRSYLSSTIDLIRVSIFGHD
jgi:hypothetical protein